jgi:hypothetical protein
MRRHDLHLYSPECILIIYWKRNIQKIILSDGVMVVMVGCYGGTGHKQVQVQKD